MYMIVCLAIARGLLRPVVALELFQLTVATVTMLGVLLFALLAGIVVALVDVPSFLPDLVLVYANLSWWEHRYVALCCLVLFYLGIVRCRIVVMLIRAELVCLSVAEQCFPALGFLLIPSAVTSVVVIATVVGLVLGTLVPCCSWRSCSQWPERRGRPCEAMSCAGGRVRRDCVF